MYYTIYINCIAIILFVFPSLIIAVINNANHYKDMGTNVSKILNAFFESGYDKRVRPNYGGAPVEVRVMMQIIGISTVSEVQMDFTSDFYFRQLWVDNRLTFKSETGISQLVVGAEVAKLIWVPDTFFANEKNAFFHYATTPNTFLRIKSNGEVYRSIRLTVTSQCPMYLQYFPMDRQKCSIEIESYGYSTADIAYVWGKGAASVELSKSLSLPQFKVVGHIQSDKLEVLSTGNYSRLVCQILFVRSMGYYLIQIYIPASLIVGISWVSFWLHRNATPARVALGVMTVLTMTTLMSSTNAALPKISYVKSIDVFLGTCFVMVFASLLEYATVGYMGKRVSMRKTRSQQLAKLAQEHRNKCAAAAAAAESLEIGHHESINQGPIICPATPMEAVQMPRQMSVKGVSMHHTFERGDRMERYQGMGTPRLVHHPITCPVPCSQEVRIKMIDNNTISRFHISSAKNTTNGGGGGGGGGAPELGTSSTPAAELSPENLEKKNEKKIFGPSDIDKYSRVVFPVCFVCFNLMYWIIYLHISDNPEPDLVPLGS